MRKITTKFYTKVAIVATLLLNSAAASAEDGYEMQIDNSCSEYTGVQVDDTRRMWIKSKWIRSYDLKNWTEDVETEIEAASTLYVRNRIIYIHGTYDSSTEKCSFLRFDAVTGEELDPIEIDFSQAEHKPEGGYIALREDDAGTVYLISACTSSNYVISFHTIDLDNCEIVQSYCMDANKQKKSGIYYVCNYPIVFGDINNGNFEVYSLNVYKISDQFNVSQTISSTDLVEEVYRNHELYSFTHYTLSDTQMKITTTISYFDEKGFVLDSDRTNLVYYKYDNTNYSTIYNSTDDSIYPLTQNQTNAIGAHFFEHSGVNMVVFSPTYMKNTQHSYRILCIQNEDMSKWIHSNSYKESYEESNGEGVFKMWDIATFTSSLPFSIMKSSVSTLAYTVNNGANTDLYVYTSGLGLAAYNIIGPGTTTEEDIAEYESSYSISNNIVTTNEPCDIAVYNIHGDEVRSATNVSSLSLSDLCKGIYIVKMSNNSEAIKVAVR